jgi:hypothetical protein
MPLCMMNLLAQQTGQGGYHLATSERVFLWFSLDY